MGRRIRRLARDNLTSNPRDNRESLSLDGDAVPHASFFVPNFTVRRQLSPNETATEFVVKLGEYCARRPYTPKPIERMGISIVEKGRFVDMFHKSDVQPEASDILALSLNVRESLQPRIKSKPHVLAVPLGGVAVFGNRNNKLAATLEGWKGFDKNYAPRDENGRTLANSQIVGEINSAVGEIVQFIEGGVDGSGEYVLVSTRAMQRQSPHFTFAEKTRGDIGNNERADIAGQIMEFMPEELEFFDPVIHMQLQTPGNEQTNYTNNPAEASVQTAGMFVRRPKFKDFGGPALEACVTSAA